MPFELEIQSFDDMDRFDAYVDSLLQQGIISESQLDDEETLQALVGEYSKSFEQPVQGKLFKGQIDRHAEQGINTLSALREFRAQAQANQQAQAENADLADTIQRSQLDWSDRLALFTSVINPVAGLALGVSNAGTQSEEGKDNAFEFSIDQAQKLAGEGLSTLGDAINNIPYNEDNWLGNWAKRVGTNIIAQQEQDIAEGGYQSSYQGSFFDQSIMDMPGWLLEKMAENVASGGVSLVGAGAAALTAPVSGAAAAGIAGATATGTSLLAIGDIASELKEKKVYDSEDAGMAVAMGLVSGALDLVGAGKVIPKGAVINKLIRDGVVHEVAEEVAKTGVLKQARDGFVAEGLTEVMQEGINVAYAASQGADYEFDEVVNRFVDSAIVGGAMGGSVGATQAAIQSAVEKTRQEKANPTLIDVAKQIETDQVKREETAGSFSGPLIDGLTPEQTRAYVATVADTESNHRLDVVNKYGYSGMYQFGASALTDVGLIKRDKYDAAPKGVKNGTRGQLEFLQNPDNWTIKGGLETFLSSREIQDKAFIDLTNLNIQRGRRSGAIPENADAGHIAGYAKAAHLVGAGAANRYVINGRDKADANGTSASKYYHQGRSAVSDTRAYRNQVNEERPVYRKPRSQITDANGKKHNVTYEVVEASEIQAAIDKSANQYRDRNRQALSQQVDSIANNLDYGLVDADSATFEQGAPALTNDGQIIAGNGRMLGIQRAYELGKAEDYRQGVIDDADYIGVDRATVESMDQPVLIRRLQDDVNVESLSILSNEGGSARMSPLEQAKVDAERIQSLHDFNPDDSGNIDYASAKGMFRRLLSGTPQNQINALQDSDGEISQEGQRRIKNALLYMAYGDSDVLTRLVESADIEQANILKALTGAAPKIAEMRDNIRQGIIFDADITPDLIHSVELFSRIKKDKNNNVESYLSQLDAFNQVSDETKLILQKLDKTTRTPNKLRDFLVAYTENLKTYGNPNQQGLFGAVEPTRTEVLQRAEQGAGFRRQADIEAGGQQRPATDERSVTQAGTEPAAPGADIESTETGGGLDASTVSEEAGGVQNNQPDQAKALPVAGNKSLSEDAGQGIRGDDSDRVGFGNDVRGGLPDHIDNPAGGNNASGDGGNNNGGDGPGIAGGDPGDNENFRTAGGPIAPRVDDDGFADGDTRNLKEIITDRLKSIGGYLGRKFRSPTSQFGVDGIAAAERLAAVYEDIKHDTSVALSRLKEIEKRRYAKNGVTQKVADDRYRYLTSADPAEKQAIDLFPEEKALLDAMRRNIDKTSNEFIDTIVESIALDYGVDINSEQFTSDEFMAGYERFVDTGQIDIEDQRKLNSALQSARNIKANIGSYLTRTYAANTHPESWNRLVLKSNEPHFRKIREGVKPYFMAEAIRLKPELEGKARADYAKKLMTDFVWALSDNSVKGSSETVLLSRSKLLDNHPELRALLGEHTDIEAAYTNAIHRMKKTLATKRFYQDMLVNMRERGTVLSDKDAEELRQINVTQGNVIRNPFYGLYTDPATADFIERTTGKDVGKLAENLMMINGIWQMTHTVASVPTAVGNLWSSIPVIIATASGSKNSLQDTFRAINYAFNFTSNSQDGEIIKRHKRDNPWLDIQAGDKVAGTGYIDRFVSDYGFTPDQMYDYAIKNQLTSGGALGGETEKYIQEGGLDVLGRRVGAVLNANGIPEALTGVIGKSFDFTIKGFQGFYNIGDSLPKLAIFFNEAKRLNELNKKYGEGFIAKNSILDAAANLAKQQAPQYSRTPEAVDSVCRFSFAGQFVAFQAQMYQTMYNQVRINLAMMRPEQNKDFLKEQLKINLDWLDDTAQTPAARRKASGIEGESVANGNDLPLLAGSRSERIKQQAIADLVDRGRTRAAMQLATVSFYTSALGAVIGGLAGVFGDDDDIGEEELAAIAQLSPDYYRFIDRQYIGRDEDDNPQFINTSRLNMYGGFTDSLKILDAYANGEIADAGEATKLFLDSIFSPFYEPTFISRTITAAVSNQDKYDRAIIVGEDGLIGNAGNVVSYLTKELLENGTSKGIYEYYKDLTTEDEINQLTGRPYSAEDAAATWAGFKPMSFDPKKQTLFWMYRIKGEERELRSRLTGRLKAFNSMPDNKIQSLISDARAQHHKLYDSMRAKIKAARALGVPDEEIKAAAKIAGISKSDFENYLANDRNPPFLLKKMGNKSIDGINFRNLSETAKRNFASNYENARRVLNSLPAY